MSRVLRFDLSTLAAPKKLAHGMMRVEGKISRVGTQDYVRDDGSIRRELRLEEDVFNDDAIESFALSPLTLDHPPGPVTANNVRQYQVGHLGEKLRRDGDYLVAPIMITDAVAIAAVNRGKNQLSCGYSCTLDETPGEHPVFGKYDAVQRGLSGNHVAIVDAARAGPEARMRLDAAGNAQICVAEATLVISAQVPKEKKSMTQLKVGKLQFEVADANIQAAVDQEIAAAKHSAESDRARADAAEKKLSHVEGEKDVLSAKLDADKMIKCDECDGTGKLEDESKCENCDGEGEYSAKNDSYDRRVASRSRSVTREAKNLATNIELARQHGITKFDDATDLKRQIARKYFAHNAPILKTLDGDKRCDAVYIQPLFEAALGAMKQDNKRTVAPEDVQRATELKLVTQDANDMDPEAARARMIARRNGGK